MNLKSEILNLKSETKKRIFRKVLAIAYKQGIYPASIHDFYIARGKGACSGFTVPAINLRSMTYDLARAIFRVAKPNNSGAMLPPLLKTMGMAKMPTAMGINESRKPGL